MLPTQAGSSLRLRDVFTSLTSDGPPHVRRTIQARVERVRRFLKRLAKAKRSPEDVVPERVITVGVAALERKEMQQRGSGDALPFDKLRGRLPKGIGGEGHPENSKALSVVVVSDWRARGMSRLNQPVEPFLDQSEEVQVQER